MFRKYSSATIVSSNHEPLHEPSVKPWIDRICEGCILLHVAVPAQLAAMLPPFDVQRRSATRGAREGGGEGVEGGRND